MRRDLICDPYLYEKPPRYHSSAVFVLLFDLFLHRILDGLLDLLGQAQDVALMEAELFVANFILKL